jgi:sec-independent protein translocase protein TatA
MFEMALIGFPGPGELLVIFLIVLLIFGGSKLPEVARSIGKSMRIFKEETTKLKREIDLEEIEVKSEKAKEKAKEETEKPKAES